MTYAVAITEQAAREMEESAAWWARERSVEQSERWYAGIRHPTLPMAYYSEEQGLGVSVYERAADGRLTLRSRPRPKPDVTPAPPLAGSDIVLTPDARHLFMGIRDFAGTGDLIAAYRVTTDGGLEPLPGTPADDVPWGMAVSADGRFLAVTNYGSKKLTVYRIGAEGGLERMTGVDVEDRIMDVVVR